MKAMILAGGEGRRLRPLTCDTPKPMIPLLGVPAMEYLIRHLLRHGITEIGVTLHYLPDAIRDYFGDGSRFGVHLTYFYEEKPLGTAGGLKKAEEFLQEDFLVISGDCLTDFDLTAAQKAHREGGAMATIILHRADGSMEYGMVMRDASGRIGRFLEKPCWDEVCDDYVNTGIYLLRPEVLAEIPNDTPYDFSRNLFPRLLPKGVYGWIGEGYWQDIGSIKAYLRCHRDLLNGKVSLPLQPFGKALTVGEDVVIERPCFIGKDAVLQRGAVIRSGSVLGEGVTVGRGAEIRGAVLHKGVIVEEGAVIEPGLLCHHARVASGTHVPENTVAGAGSLLSDRREQVPPAQEGVISGKLSPAAVTAIGRGMARLLGSGIALGVQDNAPSAMFADAFSSGALACGAELLDFGSLPLPALRHALTFYRLNGGIHLAAEGGTLTVTLLPANGANFTEEQSHALWKLAAETADVSPTVCALRKRVDGTEYYLRGIYGILEDAGKDYGVTADSYHHLLQELFPSGAGEAQAKGKPWAAFSDNWETPVLFDESGKEICAEDYWYLTYTLLAAEGERTFLLPAGSSERIEAAAKRQGVRILYTGRGKATIMNALMEHKLHAQFRMLFDAPYALARFLRFLRSRNLLLYHLAAKVPKSELKTRTIPYPRERVGTVLALLGARSNSVPSPEGVKLIFDEGWVTVIPQKGQDALRTFAESTRGELAEELCDFVEDFALRCQK